MNSQDPGSKHPGLINMHGSRLLRAALMTAVVFPFALDHVADAAYAQTQDLGSMTVSGGAKPAPRKKVRQTRTVLRPDYETSLSAS